MKQAKIMREFLTSDKREERLFGISMLAEYILLAERLYGLHEDEQLYETIMDLTYRLQKYETK